MDAGEHRLKDLGEPTRVFRLMGDGASDPRALRTLERAPHNLPIQLTTLAEALSEKASVRLKAFDQRWVEESRTAIPKALGELSYGELLEQGAKTAWGDLPLIHLTQ